MWTSIYNTKHTQDIKLHLRKYIKKHLFRRSDSRKTHNCMLAFMALSMLDSVYSNYICCFGSLANIICIYSFIPTTLMLRVSFSPAPESVDAGCWTHFFSTPLPPPPRGTRKTVVVVVVLIVVFSLFYFIYIYIYIHIRLPSFK